MRGSCKADALSMLRFMFSFKTRFVKAATTLAVCLFIPGWNVFAARLVQGVWEVKVVQVFNPKLPKLTEKQLRKTLSEARFLVKKKFGARIRFLNKGKISVKDLFEKHVNDYPKEISKIALKESDIFGSEKGLVSVSKAETIEQWSLMGMPSLRKFFQTHPACIPGTFEDIFECIKPFYEQTKMTLRNLKLNPSSPYFKFYPFEYDSSSYWLLMADYEKRWDVMITNQALIWDSPDIGAFSMTYKGVASGITSMGVTIGERRSLVVSMFPFYSGSPFFEERAGYPSDALKPHLLGEILAHELGHLLFFMPDDSEIQKPGCLMYRDWKTMQDAYRHGLIHNTSACPFELGWVTLAAAVEKWKQKRALSSAKSIQKIEQKFRDAPWQFLLRIAYAYWAIENNADTLRVLKKMQKLNLPSEIKQMIEEDIEILKNNNLN